MILSSKHSTLFIQFWPEFHNAIPLIGRYMRTYVGLS